MFIYVGPEGPSEGPGVLQFAETLYFVKAYFSNSVQYQRNRLLLNYKGSSFRQPEEDLLSLLSEGLPSQPLCDCISPPSLLGSELLGLLHY